VRQAIVGGAYVARSVNAADNQMVNLFPEAVPEGGKAAGWLQRAPGLKYQQTTGDGPIRGLWTLSDKSRFFVVSGTEVYMLTGVTATATLIGSVTGAGQVSITDNGTQVFFACNPDGFIYNVNTHAFAQITDPDFPGAVTVGYLDGYFVFNEPESQRIWVTTLLDGSSVDPLDFASAEGSPDGLVAIIINHREAWLFGTGTVEVWYDAGLADFPLARIQGAFNEVGCVAPYTVAKMDNAVFWLGQDDRGQGIIYRAAGYQAKRISTHAVEWKIQQSTDLGAATAYTYQQDGHSFYMINVPDLMTTFAYDMATQLWHERRGFSNGDFTRHRGNAQCNFNGAIVIGDYQTGDLYTFDLETYADNGEIQKWLRSWRALTPGRNNLTRTSHHSLQLDCRTGVGLVTGQGSDPQIMLEWSDDGGHTWSNSHWQPMGAIGATQTRTIWRRLGMTLKSRDRVYRISGTDPVPIAIMGAELNITPTGA